MWISILLITVAMTPAATQNCQNNATTVVTGYDITNIIHDYTQEVILRNVSILYNLAISESTPLYYKANGNTSTDTIIWNNNKSYFINTSCSKLGIEGISFIFSKNANFSGLLKLPVQPMGNDTLLSLLNADYYALINSVILSVRFDWYISPDPLNDYLQTGIRVIGPHKTANSSNNLGLEFNHDQFSCCADSMNFEIFRFANPLVMRVEIDPLGTLFSYGIFHEMMDNAVTTNRNYIRNVLNLNSTLLVRIVVTQQDDLHNDILSRSQFIIAEYTKAWRNEMTSDNDTVVISPVPNPNEFIPMEEHRDFLRNRVSTVFSPTMFKPYLNILQSNNNNYSCELQEIVKTVFSVFGHIVFSNFSWHELQQFWESCPANFFMSKVPTSFVFGNTIEAVAGNTIDDQNITETIEWITSRLNIINIDTIYLTTEQNNLMHIINLLRVKNISIGCHVRLVAVYGIMPYIPIAETVETIVKDCGVLFNVISSEVLCLITVQVVTYPRDDETLVSFLEVLNKVRIMFEKMYPEKNLVPWITIQVDYEFRESSPCPTCSICYCDPDQKTNNEYYDAVVNFAKIQNWTKIVLRAAMDDYNQSNLPPNYDKATARGWWRFAQPDDSEINRSITQFHFLVRSNAGKCLQIESIPMTYSCIEWTKDANQVGIQFLKNINSGTSILLNLRENDIVTAKELETLLLFAFGRFTFVEVVASDQITLQKSISAWSPILLQAIKNYRRLQEISTPLIYFELPCTGDVMTGKRSLIERYKSFIIQNNTAIHISKWEDIYHEQVKPLAYTNHTTHATSRNFPHFGITVQNCSHEMNLRLLRLKSLPFINYVSYVICNVKPVLAKNNDKLMMQSFFDTLFYTKLYIEKKLFQDNKTVEVIFRINLICKQETIRNRESVDGFLKFFNDVNQHSAIYNVKYFLVRAFDSEESASECDTSWWHLKSYKDLTNISLYVDREEEYFGRPTVPRILLPPVPAPKSNSKILIILLPLLFSALFISTAMLGVWYYFYREKRNYLTNGELDQFFNGAENETDMLDDENINDALSMQFPENLKISKENIELGGILGMGQFGVVHRGMLSEETEIAVKIPRSDNGKEHFLSALKELKILCFIGVHPHVVVLLGAYTKEIAKGKLYIVMEYCENGSLRDYLRKMQVLVTENRCSADLYEMQKFSFEIALGMEYIAKKKIVHGDLAARNVLLTAEMNCKISDFGLSRKLYALNEYEYEKKGKEPLPWKWMALESLKHMKFTSKSDVWSYAVTLWEIYSLGTVPYPGLVLSGQDFTSELENGMRMGKAQYSTEDIHEQLVKCWSTLPDDRPTFTDLVSYFAGLNDSEYTTLYE